MSKLSEIIEAGLQVRISEVRIQITRANERLAELEAKLAKVEKDAEEDDDGRL